MSKKEKIWISHQGFRQWVVFTQHPDVYGGIPVQGKTYPTRDLARQAIKSRESIAV